MKSLNLNTRYFFWLLLITGVALAYLLLPFMTAILVAAILAGIFHGVYEYLLFRTRQRRGLSASLTLLLIAIIIIFPFAVVVSLLSLEAKDVYLKYMADKNALSRLIGDIQVFLSGIPFFRGLVENGILFPQSDLVSGLQNSGKFVFGILQKTYSGTTQFMFWLFILFFTLFYFLIDGKKFVSYLMRLSPLRDRQDQMIIDRFSSITRATIKGTLIIGIVQGILAGILFALTGVTSPVLWGVVTVFFSLIPMVGAGIVWMPIGLTMLFLGHVWQGAAILVFGFGVVSTIDNILRPKLVGGDTAIHPLLIFFSTLGGIFVFGIAGFLIGPIVVAIFLSLLDIYEDEFANDLGRYNE